MEFEFLFIKIKQQIEKLHFAQGSQEWTNKNLWKAAFKKFYVVHS